MVLSMIGIIIGLVFLIVMVMKGWPLMIVGALASMLVAVFSGINVINGYLETYMSGMGGFLIGQIASDATVASIGIALGRGTLISIILVLFVLPQILLLGDIIIEKTALTINLPQATRRDVSGRMIVNGRVKGYIQGEIDAEIKGSFSGSMQASFESRLPIGGKETELVMEQEGLTQPDDAAKPDTVAQPDDVSQPNTAAQPGEQDAKKEDSDEEQNEQL